MANKSRYFRISINNNCNLNCYFCHHEGQGQENNINGLLSPDDIAFITKCALESGYEKVKLTGGEPLLRHDIVLIIEKLLSLKIKDLSIITNGTMLTKKALALKKAGLKRINVSLHTLDPDRFYSITRGSKLELETIINGIDYIIELGFKDTKINFVYLDETSDDDLLDMINFVKERNLTLVLLPVINSSDSVSTTTLGNLYLKLMQIGIEKSIDVIDEEGIKKILLTLNNGAKVLLRKEELSSHKPYNFCEKCISKSLCREGIFPIRLSSNGTLIPCLAGNLNHQPLLKQIKEKDLPAIMNAFSKITSWRNETNET